MDAALALALALATRDRRPRATMAAVNHRDTAVWYLVVWADEEALEVKG